MRVNLTSETPTPVPNQRRGGGERGGGQQRVLWKDLGRKIGVVEEARNRGVLCVWRGGGGGHYHSRTEWFEFSIGVLADKN